MPPLPYHNARPYTRWWWFSGAIREADVRAQLDWAARNGFGGVEIAWVYPQPGAAPGPRWLSPEWSAIVAFTRRHADSIGLGCDLTLGTLWPFGGSIVGEADAARTFAGPSPQRLDRSWEMPHAPPGYILNHLDRHALRRYAERMGAALGEALRAATCALFCDSWEVAGEDLWTAGFDRRFRDRCGYDVVPFMADLDDHPHVRYDYRKLLAQLILDEFYRPFTDICHELGAVARVQCHGAPTDLLAAYAAVDVPETEAVLFDPPFARLAASAAALAGRPIVSAEAFTCLYGWEPYPGPGPHQGEELIGDLKLVADALFANGVNAIVWHGLPYNPPGGSNRFYASVHLGPDAAFADDLPAFNDYLARVGGSLRQGDPCGDIAVYLPLEDAWMGGALPEAQRRPSARYEWELQHVRLPPELAGYRPLWVSAPFLAGAMVEDGRLRCGPQVFQALYLDVTWLDAAALADVLRLATDGLPVCLRQLPSEPGHRPSSSHDTDLERLLALPNVASEVGRLGLPPPFLAGEDLPEFWCRRAGDDHLIFFAHPATRGVTYPLRHGQSLVGDTLRRACRVSVGDREIPLDLVFEPFQSLLVRIAGDGTVRFEDIAFTPSARSIDRQVDHFVALAEAAELALTGPDQAEWLARLEANDENLRAAIQRSLSTPGAAAQALRLTGALWRYWLVRGRWAEGLELLKRALDGAGTDVPAAERVKALRGAANLATSKGDCPAAAAFEQAVLAICRSIGDQQGVAASLSHLGNISWSEGLYSAARAMHEEALAIRRSLGDQRGIAGSLLGLGNVVSRAGNHVQARAYYEESLAIYRALGDANSIAGALLNLGNAALFQGDFETARRNYQESLDLGRQLGDRRRAAFALGNLGDVAWRSGDLAAAREWFEEALRHGRELSDRPSIANALLSLGDLDVVAGDLAAARPRLAEGLTLARQVGDRVQMAEGVESFARLAAAEERPRRTARLLGAADRLRRTIGAAAPPFIGCTLEEAAATARHALGDAAFDAAWVDGAMLWVDDAVTYALGTHDPWATWTPGPGVGDKRRMA